MKLFVAALLSVSAVSGSGMMSDWHTYKNWAEMKAQESCWGDENMKQYMVKMKQAVAKCNQVDAPELNLPPFKSTYRFINTLLTGADDMEDNKMMFFMKMMQKMNNRHNNYENNYNNNDDFESMFESMMNNKRHQSNSYNKHDSSSWMEKMMKKIAMKKMLEKMDFGSDFNMDTESFGSNSNFDEESFMKNMMEYKMKNMNTDASSNYRQRMAELLSRNKRMAEKDSAATLPVSLDIGDRLADKVKAQQHQMENKIGNMTCVLRETGILNQQNELDARAQKQYMNQFKVDKWLQDRINDGIDTCVELAENIPSEYNESYNYPGFANVAQIKMYTKCIKYSKMRSCMYKDVKEKLETNFGPVDKILEQTQLSEDQLYPLVMNLMHGDEMEYNF